MITLTPLSSSASSASSSEPICYLLQLDEARILLDVGQRDYRANSERTSWEYEEKIRQLAPTLSLVLLSHSTSQYLGLYPYARARWGLKCPVYATQPTVEMGRVVCLAEAEGWRSEHDVEDTSATKDLREGVAQEDSTAEASRHPLRGPFVPTVEEVHEAFDAIKSIRYNQPLHLGGELAHLLLTPFPSGYVLGGTLFKIRSPTSGTILYATGINHTAERHLDGMVGGPGSGPEGYADGVLRPDVLIVEGGRSEVVNPKRRDREKALIDVVTSTLQSDRSILVPVDPSPRLLELLVLLDQHWAFRLTAQAAALRKGGPPNGAGADAWPYPLCVVSRTAEDMLAFARSLVEWMGGVVRDSGGGLVMGKKGKKNRGTQEEIRPLDFQHVRFYPDPMSLYQAQPAARAKLVLAIPPSMSYGPSRWLFTAMAGVEGNVVLLTARGEDGTFARQMYDAWAAQQDEGNKWGRGGIGRPAQLQGQVQVEINSKVPLAGEELEAYLEADRLQKEREAAHQAALTRSRRQMLEADDLDSESEDESDGEEGAANDGIVITRAPKILEDTTEKQMSFDIFVKGQQMRVGRSDGEGSAVGTSLPGVGVQMRFRMFPFMERRGRKVDEYGEGLDVGVWIRKGKEIEEEGETEEVRQAKKRKLEEEEKQKQPEEPPSKYVTEQVSVDMKASVFFVDMEGMHDGQAIKTIIQDLQPRKLAIIRSSRQAANALLSAFAASQTVTKDIFRPDMYQEVVLGEHVASFSIMLGDSLNAGLGTKWAKFEGYEVVTVNGKIVFSAGSTVPTIETTSFPLPPAPQEKPDEPEPTVEPQTQPEPELKPADVADVADGPAAGDAFASADGQAGPTATGVDVKAERRSPSPAPEADGALMAKKRRRAAPARSTAPMSLPSSLFVGDLRLAALKARLSAKAIPAEFAGEGVLICGPGVANKAPDAKTSGSTIVAVRKLGEGRIVLEGSLGKVYYEVRRELYGGLAQVAGS